MVLDDVLIFNAPFVLIVILFETVSTLEVLPLNCKVAAVPAPTVKELQAAFAFLIRTSLPFGIKTLSVAVGTPDGLQVLATSHAALATAVFVTWPEIFNVIRRTKNVRDA